MGAEEWGAVRRRAQGWEEQPEEAPEWEELLWGARALATSSHPLQPGHPRAVAHAACPRTGRQAVHCSHRLS